MESSGIKDQVLYHAQPRVQWMQQIVSCMVVWSACNEMSNTRLKIDKKPCKRIGISIKILKSLLKT